MCSTLLSKSAKHLVVFANKRRYNPCSAGHLKLTIKRPILPFRDRLRTKSAFIPGNRVYVVTVAKWLRTTCTSTSGSSNSKRNPRWTNKSRTSCSFRSSNRNASKSGRKTLLCPATSLIQFSLK